MYVDNGTLIGIMIALVGSCVVMVQALRENYHLQVRIRDLQVALRNERRK